MKPTPADDRARVLGSRRPFGGTVGPRSWAYTLARHRRPGKAVEMKGHEGGRVRGRDRRAPRHACWLHARRRHELRPGRRPRHCRADYLHRRDAGRRVGGARQAERGRPRPRAAAVTERLAKQIDERGTIDVLRHGVEDLGVHLRLAYFRPASGLSPDLEAKYNANRLTVIRQLHYAPEHANALDLVLFVNGLPVATAELKNPLTYPISAATTWSIVPASRSSVPRLTHGSGRHAGHR